MPAITLKYKDKVLEKYQIGIGQTLTIGRNESNDIIIDNLAVSANHARIESVSASFIIKDLESTNGTFVNEKLVSAHGLRNNDIILVGKHNLIFYRSDLDQQINLEETENLDEKTRALDTAEYRELIDRAKSESNGNPSSIGRTASRDMSGGLFTRIWRRLFG